MESALAHDLDGGQRTEDVRLKDVAPFTGWLLKPEIKRGILAAGFRMPTVIQASAIPVGKTGLDLLIQSKAGTGKTLIFSTILLEICYDAPGLHSLIVAPTREIALQIENVLNKIARSCKGYEVVSAIGGTDVTVVRKRLQNAKTVVGTPGRLVHLIQSDILKTSDIKLVVLDEADQLYSDSHRKNLEIILNAIPEDRQILACSATFCNNLDADLAKIMRNPLLISSNDRIAVLIGIKQFVYELPSEKTSVLEMEAKINALDGIFKRIPFKLCVVFANSQSRAESYSNYLKKLNWECELISGALQQTKRNEIFKKFCSFQTRILVSTDLMARGVDSEHVNLVINLEPPKDMVTYLHRIGRAGRFGSYGIAITFISSESDKKCLQKISSEIGSGLNMYRFPKDREEIEDENFWDPTTFSNDNDNPKFELYEKSIENDEYQETAILRTHDNKENIQQKQQQNDENHKNLKVKATKILYSIDDSNISIDTETFCMDSKDSAVNIVLSSAPPLDKEKDKENILLCQPEDTPTSNRSSVQLSANTIDDASSIAADSQFSLQQDLLAPHPSLVNDVKVQYTVLESLEQPQNKRIDILKNDIFMDYCTNVLNVEEDSIQNEFVLEDKMPKDFSCPESFSVEESQPKNKAQKYYCDLFADYTNCIQASEDDSKDEQENEETEQSIIATLEHDFSNEKPSSMQVCVDSTNLDTNEITPKDSVAQNEILQATDSQNYLQETGTNGSYSADSEPSDTNTNEEIDENQPQCSAYFFDDEQSSTEVNENNDNDEVQSETVLEENLSPVYGIWMNEYWNQVNFIRSYTDYVLKYKNLCMDK